MKASEIVVGGRYVAKVSVRETVVRVLAIRNGVSWGDRVRTIYDVVNERTNRQTTFHSAAKFRRSAVGVSA